MATPHKSMAQINDRTPLTDLTVGEFKQLMAEIVDDLVWKLDNSRTHPDDEMPLKPEIEQYLQRPLTEKTPFFTMDEVEQELGLDE